MKPTPTPATSVVKLNDRLLEIVTLKRPDNQRIRVVLTRGEIFEALGRNSAGFPTNGWSSIELNEEDFIRASLPKHYDTRRNRERVEVGLAGRVVHKPYSIAELGVTSAQELLQKFFENKTTATNAWWMKRDSPEANNLREPNLVATLKANGFEVARMDIAPLLLARPKPAIH